MKRFAALRLLRLGPVAFLFASGLVPSSGGGGLAVLWVNDPPAPPPVRRLVPVTNRYDAPATVAAAEQNLTYIVESSVVVRDIDETRPRGEGAYATDIRVLPVGEPLNPRETGKASLGLPL